MLDTETQEKVGFEAGLKLTIPGETLNNLIDPHMVYVYLHDKNVTETV